MHFNSILYSTRGLHIGRRREFLRYNLTNFTAHDSSMSGVSFNTAPFILEFICQAAMYRYLLFSVELHAAAASGIVYGSPFRQTVFASNNQSAYV